MGNLDCVESPREQTVGLSVGEVLDWINEVGRPALNVGITIQWTGVSDRNKGRSKLSISIHNSLLPGCRRDMIRGSIFLLP